MKNTMRCLFILSLVMISAACTRKADDRRHDQAVAVENAGAGQAESDIRPTASSAQMPLSAELSTNASALVSRVESLLAVSALRADARRLRNIQVIREFHSVSAAVVAILNSATAGNQAIADDNSMKRILAAYKTALFESCDARLNSCQFTSFFRQDPSTSRIARAIAEQESDLEGKYRAFRMAYALKNSTADDQLDIAYLTHSHSYIRNLSASSAPGSQNALREHREVVMTILNRLSTRTDLQLSPSTLAEYRPWDFSRERDPSMESIDEAVLSLAVRTGIYNPSLPPSAGQAAQVPSFSAEFNARVTAVASRPTGLLARLQAVKAKAPTALRAIDVPETIELNEYFFIYENLFDDLISPNGASAIWEALRKDIPKAQRALEQYSRMRFMLQALEVNQSMQEFFASEGRFTGQTLLEETFKEGEAQAQRWQAGLRRLRQLRTFFERHLNDSSAEATRLVSFYSSMDRNVKYVSTYPVMLLAAFQLAKLDFEIVIRTWYSTMRIDGAQILNWYFSGTNPPWFRFSEDTAPLSKSEVSIAFAAALKMGMLEGSGMSYKEFFGTAIAQALQADGAKVRDRVIEFRTRFDNNPDFQEFQRVCSTKNSQSPISPLAPVSIATMEHQLYLGLGGGGFSQSNVSPILDTALVAIENDRVFSIREPVARVPREMGEIAEFVRMEFSTKLDQMLALAKLVETHVKETKTRAEADQIINDIRSMMTPFERLRAEFYGRWFALQRAILPCLDWVFQEELSSQEAVLRAFVKRLREVHAAMTRLPDAGQQSFSQEFAFASKPGFNFPELARHEAHLGFSKHSFRFSKLQAMLFFKSVLENGAETDSGPIPARRAVGTYVLPQRMAQLEASLVNQVMEIRYSQDVEEFVSTGVKSLVGGMTHRFIHWYLLDSRTSNKMRILALTSFYKAGEVTALSCTGNACRTDGQNSRVRVTADDLIKLTLGLARIFEINSEWAKILRYAGQRWRYSSNGIPIPLVEFAYRESDYSLQPVLDLPFSMVMKQVVGAAPTNTETSSLENPLNQVVGTIEEARRYITWERTARSLQNSVIPLSQEMFALMRTIYVEPAFRDLRLRSEFIQNVQARTRANETFAWRVNLERLDATPLPLLSPLMSQEFRSQVQEFARDTGERLPPELVNF